LGTRRPAELTVLLKVVGGGCGSVGSVSTSSLVSIRRLQYRQFKQQGAEKQVLFWLRRLFICNVVHVGVPSTSTFTLFLVIIASFALIAFSFITRRTGIAAVEF
jgi:hypothetical protein